MANRIQIRRDTSTNWGNANPILSQGELGLETNTGKLKIGNGSTLWNNLAYFADGASIDLASVEQSIIPDVDDTYDLGSPDKQWRDLFVSGGSIYLGDIKLSNDSGILKVQQVTNPGTDEEAPIPGNPGVVTTDRLISNGNSLVLDLNGEVKLNGEVFSGGASSTELPFLELTNDAIIFESFVSEPVDFTKEDYGDQVDVVDAGLHITRGDNQGIFNPLLEPRWDDTTQDGPSPAGTLWNIDGWGDLTNLESRLYFKFYEAYGGNIGGNILGSEPVMKDVSNNRYYKFEFTVWGNANQGAPVTYTRTELDPVTGEALSEPVTFVKDGYADPTEVNDVIGVSSEYWFSSLSPASYLEVIDIAADGDGNVYVTGNSGDDILIVKYSSSGSLIWQRTLSSGSYTFVYGVAADSDGNVYVTGKISNSVFIAKYSSSGSLIWQRMPSFGLTENWQPSKVATDRDGNVYLSKTTVSNGGFINVSLFKYSSSGLLIWARRIPLAEVGDIATDSEGNVFVTGQLRRTGESDIFIAKYSSSGLLIWQRKLNAPNPFEVVVTIEVAITIDADGNTYVTGNYSLLSEGSFEGSFIYIVKYSSSGSLIWQRKLDNNVYTGIDNALDIATDSDGNVYVTGSLGLNILIVKYSSSGSLIWQRMLDNFESYFSQIGIVIIDGDMYVTSNIAGKIIIFKLPGDGSKIGTFDSYYNPTEITDQDATFIDQEATLFDQVESTLDQETTLTDQESTLISQFITGITLARGNVQGLYNIELEEAWSTDGDGLNSPAGTLWNASGWGNLRDVPARSYSTFLAVLGNQIGNNIIGTELVMWDTINDKYWAVKFSAWTRNAEGGGFSYTRQQINTSQLFVKTDYGSEVDEISEGLHITRGEGGWLYNPLEDEGHDDNTPTGSVWNNDGWDDFSNVESRTYQTLESIWGGNFNEIVGARMVMKDTTTDKYWAIQFLSWTQGQNGGGVSYLRYEIDLDQLQEGITFADGTILKSAEGLGRVKSTAPGNRRIEEVAGYKQVSVTGINELFLLDGNTVARPGDAPPWDIFVDSESYPDIATAIDEYGRYSNEGGGYWQVTINGTIYKNNVEVYVAGNNDQYFVIYTGGGFVNYNEGDSFTLSRVTGGDSVVWWNKDELPSGGNNFRGAIIDYHAYTGESTIIGTIHIVDDDGEEHISHQEVQSGSTDGENDDLWLVTSEGQIRYRRIDGESKTLKIHWTAKVFYGSELYD
jgi:hypothetical protein